MTRHRPDGYYQRLRSRRLLAQDVRKRMLNAKNWKKTLGLLVKKYGADNVAVALDEIIIRDGA